LTVAVASFQRISFPKELNNLPTQEIPLNQGQVHMNDPIASTVRTCNGYNILYAVDLYREVLYKWSDVYNSGLEAIEVFREKNCPDQEETLP
jgi:hypothetical protein